MPRELATLVHAATSKMKAGSWGSLGATAGNSPSRAQRRPLGTAPNPHLLQQLQIKAPDGRLSQVKKQIQASVPGAATLSEAPPSSLPGGPGAGSPPAPSTGAWRSHQPQWVHPSLCFSFPSPGV